MTEEELAERFADRYDAVFAARMVEFGSAGNTGIPEYLDLQLVAVGPGYAVCELQVHADLLNPAGVAHGAVVASLVDHTLGITAMPLIPQGSWPATLEFKLNYLAPVREGVLSARGEVLSVSNRTAVVQVECTNRERPVAMALGTVAVVPPKASTAGT